MNIEYQTEFDPQPGARTTPSAHAVSLANKELLTHDTVEQLDNDESLRFQLRGGPGFGALADPAMPLFGLAVRLRKLVALPEEDVLALYGGVCETITAIEVELRRDGVDENTLRTYSYCLCAYLDEVAMTRPWGAPWMAQSLLSRFHQETYGGEKFFTILARLSQEPSRNRDLLEFMYLCLVMGFRGKYSQTHGGDDALHERKVELHRIIRQLRGPAPALFVDATANVVNKPVSFTRQWPWWAPWPIGAVVLAVVFAIYKYRLHHVTLEIEQALRQILPH
ncbi:type IVB secretion system protein IcmH/DotU [Lysobacter arvi]|uniref:Type IVB secretion system protein IcmH/DotU n=1 Tax=Lysobacter arvi TaxID=3038776 RepID=A0ABU1CEJ9_9GAMM|nr:type IVB secretion system protein IcmH/DotU [Lysobacter arvi]MDR0183467.1 type IVB secretion system protein IcmH/DotU [Lysobacter arvi]